MVYYELKTGVVTLDLTVWVWLCKNGTFNIIFTVVILCHLKQKVKKGKGEILHTTPERNLRELELLKVSCSIDSLTNGVLYFSCLCVVTLILVTFYCDCRRGFDWEQY